MSVERIKVLVTVKAYPALSRKYGEVVCVAGIRTDTPTPESVRLFPLPYRDLPFDKWFKKYEVITLDAERHSGDKRPETYRPHDHTIQRGEHLDTKKDKTWSARRAFVEPLLVESMCEVLARQRENGTSLGAFRPWDVQDLLVDRADPRDVSKDEIAAQPTLFFQTKQGLEQVPYRWRYKYRCSPSCKGHTQSMIDWELSESWRAWRERYEDETVLLAKIREKFLDQMCAPSRDTIFFVGNQHVHPAAFLTLGVFWPPKT